MPDTPRENRRNYYRVLHVQPEAPLEVIKASYRTLMSKLRTHPDLGGDVTAAQLLNEAYAVLSDPQRRAAYDRELVRHWERVRERERAAAAARRAAQGGAGTGSGAGAGAGPVAPEASPVPACPICGTALPAVIHIDTRCLHCDAPLAALPEGDAAGHELFGRRRAVRRDRHQAATLYVGWPATRMPARWRDVSLNGLSVYCAQPVVPGQTVRVVDAALDAVARVVSCRPSGRAFTVHARLLTALFTQTAGVFVSDRA